MQLLQALSKAGQVSERLPSLLGALVQRLETELPLLSPPGLLAAVAGALDPLSLPERFPSFCESFREQVVVRRAELTPVHLAKQIWTLQFLRLHTPESFEVSNFSILGLSLQLQETLQMCELGCSVGMCPYVGYHC